MARELTRFDHVKKCYSKLHDVNQRLKNISGCYYISHTGNVFMKSLAPFLETFIELRYPELIDIFNGAMILPNTFFSFAKNAKKTKLIIEETPDKIKLGQDNDPELTLDINIVNPNMNDDLRYIKDSIEPKMYKRYFELQNEDLYTQYEDEDLIKITDDEYNKLMNAESLLIPYNNTVLTITKHLFTDAKKDDSIEIRRLCYQHIDGDSYRVFYMIDHICDIYTAHTIFNVLQNI